MKYLFIGGPAAGMVIDVDPRQTFVRVPKSIPAPVSLHGKIDMKPITSVESDTLYKWDCATGKDGQRRVFYVAEGGSVDTLDLLLDFYASQPHPETK